MSMMTQAIRDYHYHSILEDIKNGSMFSIMCLNWMKNNACCESARKDWAFIGAELVMHGHLTVNDKNDFFLKEIEL